jgi:2-polyprenyl-6-methoxyphenol hydroxylase-like FAD-dependent oxidoreductase
MDMLDEGAGSTDVVIVGAGPTGLMLAIILGQAGIRCCLIERNEEPLFLPKMELCNARSMELFGRLGIAERVVGGGAPSSAPMDAFLLPALMDEPIAHVRLPSAEQMAYEILWHNDGYWPREPYLRISQYDLEPILKEVAEKLPNVRVLFGHELEDFAEDGDAVTARIRASGGEEYTKLRARYLVGCDGAASGVRKALRVSITGKWAVARSFQLFLRCDELMELHPHGPARHYNITGSVVANLRPQGDFKHWAVDIPLGEDTDPDAIDVDELLARIVGVRVQAEILRRSVWTLHSWVADRFRVGRCFLAGDAAHTLIPAGGFGMNTGLCDAFDLGWKLIGTLQGWGGPGLLDSYDAERQPVARRNAAAAERV